MKNSYWKIFFAFSIISTLLLVKTPDAGLAKLTEIKPTSNVAKLDKYDRADLAMQQEFMKTRNPKTGRVEREKLIDAYEQAKSKNRSYGRTEVAGVTWTERGPNNVAGRTRAILIDANDGTGSTVFAAGVSGGLWKTTDITAASPNWTVVNDFFDNLAIVTIAQDPTDPLIMYFGTGEGYFNLDAVRGDGIWKSTDGGTTWAQLSSTTGFDFDYVQKIVVTSSGTVVAATRGAFTNNGGIQRSTDGGVIWTTVESGMGARDWASDVEKAANGDLYASFGIFHNDGIYKSTDDGLTWSRVYISTVNEERIELAPAPSDADYVYAVVQDSGNGIGQIMRTTDGGTNWNTLSATSWSDQCAAAVTDFTRGQAWYDLIAAVDPNDEDHVIVGGVDLLKTADGGTTWTQITEWANCSSLADIHADQHALVFAPGSSSILYAGNDGGIYASNDANVALPSFTHKNTDYNITQFYSCAIHPTAGSNHFLAGAQDNGSQKFSSIGINSTVEVTGGDGAFCHIDKDEPQYQFTSFVFSLYRVSTDGGSTFSDVNFSGSEGKFINPSDYDNDADVFYSSFSTGNYLVWTDPQTGNSASNVSAGFSSQVSAVTTDSNTANRVWFGTDDGSVYRVDNANTAPGVTDFTDASFPSGYITCIEIEDGDADHLVITFSNYGVNSVWETTNGGTSWTSIEGDLPDMPVRWVLFSPLNSDELLLATEVGVWTTDNIDGASTSWYAANTGLANVRTDMLQLRESDNIVIAATHGRGVYSTDIFSVESADFIADKTTGYLDEVVQFTDGSVKATSWSWDFGDGATSTSQSPSHTYSVAGVHTVVLTINGGSSSETKTDYIHILPNKGTPYEPTDGGGFEVNPDDFTSISISGTNLWERGVPTNELTTLNSGTQGWKTDLDTDIPEEDIECALLTPNYNFTAAGTYTLAFRKSMEASFANAPQAAQVHYSTNKGISWIRLGGFSDGNGTNWYERSPSATFSIHPAIVADETGFNGTYTNEATTYDVSFLAGNGNVSFRFVYYVAAGFGGGAATYAIDGFMIDDFDVGGPPNDPLPSAILPVQLTEFKGEYKANNIQLEWKTSSELNSDYFEIQRSYDGKNFEYAGKVNGNGTVSSPKAYDFVDDNYLRAKRRAYYRLRQVDFDGQFEYSKAVSVDIPRPIELAVYPNPVKDQINVLLSGGTTTNYGNVQLLDIRGRVYHNEEFSVGTDNGFQINLESNKLPGGIYFLNITIDGQLTTKKILVE